MELLLCEQSFVFVRITQCETPIITQRNIHAALGPARYITELCITKSPPRGETKNMQFSKQKKTIKIKILQGKKT